ncbi:heavy metal translocating P-type ATPase [Bacillaceae bacterium S4-13-56]
MSSNAELLSTSKDHPSVDQTSSNKRILNQLKEHWELLAVGISGVLILIAWFTESTFSAPVTAALYIGAYVIGGYAKAKEGFEETIEKRDLNVELLMVLAAIGAAAIGYWVEGAILIFIFGLSGALETYTMNKSHKEISALMDLQPEEALRIKNGREELVAVKELEIGDQILIKAGERVPSDGMIIKGATSIDEAAITGESIPVNKTNGEEVFAGTVNLNGSITVEITKPQSETLFQKIIQLVQSAQSEKSPSQLFIEKFEGVYVKSVIVVVGIMMFMPHFVFGWGWQETIYRAMVLLVVASPCALMASIMPATLSSISNGARHGILFKGGVHVENLGHLKAIAFDKTGTLTQGKPKVTDVFVSSEENQEQILSSVAAIEKQSNHPLAQAVVRYVKEQNALDPLEVDHVFDTSGNGVSATINGVTWKIGKGKFVGVEEATDFWKEKADELADQGKTLVFASKEKKIVALIALKDTIRKDTKQALQTLKNLGIYTVMLTGDHERTAKAIADECGIDHYIAGCLPEEKVNHVKELNKHFEHIAMVGDGINDAPALASANVGIAMGEGTDVALETADVVLMKNELPKIAEAIKLSKRMNVIVKQNVVFSLAVITLLIISNFLQFIDLPLGVIGHEGSTILVILNGLRLLK